jgi:hypothetical protein
MGARTLDATELAVLIRECDPIAVAALLPAAAPTVTFTRSPAPEDWLVDGASERPVAEHRDAHQAGRPSEAAVAYGAGHEPDAVAERIAALARLAAQTGLLRAVCPVPGDGTDHRPGSWGVEDLTVVAVCRLALPEGVAVRPHWRRLGPAACQVAVAFGATGWRIPEDDRADTAHLAAAVGAEAVSP